MVFRLMAGLGAAGVDRALMMPAADGVGERARRQLPHARPRCAAPFPELEVLGCRSTARPRTPTAPSRRWSREGVAAIVVLGGDGTHRVVAKACGDTPICALSTGTNNVFPEMREATVAGLAAGLVATGRAGPTALRREGAARASATAPSRPRARRRRRDPRALRRRPRAVARRRRPELFVAFADPSAVGLSSIAGLLRRSRAARRGLHVRLAANGRRDHARSARAGPGRPVASTSTRADPGEPVALGAGDGASRSTASARSSAAATSP